MANLENLIVPLKEIKLATGNFSKENLITDGVFGEVYKGKLFERRKNSTAAFKRFIKDRCHGKEEFHNELKFIPSLNHENIVPFIGYCDESNEMIIVYEYPVNGSLHLDDNGLSCLTWAHRLKICMDVARALNYLHSGLGEYGRVIHGSVTESNILLDNNLRAKICGFDLSVLIPGNQPRQQVYKPAATTRIDFMDPIYLETGFLKGESDVYSFGWILYGMLTWSGSYNGMGTISLLPKSLPMFIKHCCDNRLDRLIDPLIRDQIGGPSFHMIHELTCKCISYSLKDRPTMDMIVKTIEEALNYHKAVKEDHVLNAKVLEAADAYIKNSSNLTKLNTHIKEVIEIYRQSSTNLLNLAEMLKEANVPGLMHTLEAIKNTINTQADHHANGSSFITPRVNKGKRIARDIDNSPLKLVKASRKVHPDPDGPVLINYEIDKKMVQITNDELQAHLDKKE
uniref:Protein kinase, ATP binding site-containing protein n=1 Tax=Tanacetum cinerariifolium TaxID=118510 RepID=A0A6L2MT24_TANCI|nr:protein kinase, ATP binding site-containing protein [Tanacetum cinerariifolium]